MLLSSNYRKLFTETVNSASTTTLISTSNQQQHFTGIFPQTVILPLASTMLLGQTFQLTNRSNSELSVQSSGLDIVITILPGQTAIVCCIKVSGTDASSWIVIDNIASCISTSNGNNVTSVCTNKNDATEISGDILDIQALRVNDTGLTSLGYCSSLNLGNQYFDGVASQTGTTITGVGTTFTSTMVGGIIIFEDLTRATITNVVNSTTLTVSVSQSVLVQPFNIYYGNKYNTGTAGQSGTTVTGVNTLWSGAPNYIYDLTRAILIFDGSSVPVKVVSIESDTSLVVDTVQTISSGTTYNMYFGGANNTSVGLNTLKNSEFASNTVVIGANAMSDSNYRGNGTIAIGNKAMQKIGNGANNIAIGSRVLENLSKGDVVMAGATASQSGTTITGVGTQFTEEHVGSTIIFSDLSTAYINSYVSPTQVISNSPQTVTPTQTFTLVYGGTTDTNTNNSLSYSQSGDIVTVVNINFGTQIFEGYEGYEVWFQNGSRVTIVEVIKSYASTTVGDPVKRQ
jgi:hypothetical protein